MSRVDRRARAYDLARAVRNRARGRAATRLQKLHAAEFDGLLAEELLKASVEAELLEQVAGFEAGAAARAPRSHAQEATTTDVVVESAEPALVKLRPGARGAGEEVVDRVARPDVGDCAYCIQRHDRDHVCPVCNTKPQLTPGPLKQPTVVPLSRAYRGA